MLPLLQFSLRQLAVDSRDDDDADDDDDDDDDDVAIVTEAAPPADCYDAAYVSAGGKPVQRLHCFGHRFCLFFLQFGHVLLESASPPPSPSASSSSAQPDPS